MTFPSFTRKRYLPVGFDMESGEELSIALDYLGTHFLILGPPGSGKTRWLTWLFQQLTRIPKATIFFFTSKGTVCHQARAWAISRGLTARVDWLGLDDPDHVLGYSPLRPNGLSVATHAKAVREGVRSAWGQAAFDDTPQLARFLFLILFAVRELELTFVEALAMLRPQSEVRQAILPAIRDSYVRQSLEYLNALREPRQDELLASTLARLEAFVADPMIRRILTQQKHSFNVGEAIANHRIVLGPFLNYAPLRPDDNRLLARLVINDLVAHTFAQPNSDPVFLIIDEAHDFITEDLCRILAQGRELKLHAVLAHQFLRQLRTEETTIIQDSIWECARTKVIFGGVSTRELEELTAEVMIDRFDPAKIKDEIRTLEQEAIETQRTVITEGESTSESLTRGQEISEGKSHSRTEAQEQSQGQSLGVSTELGESETLGETETYTQGTVNTQGRAVSDGEGSGASDMMTTGETILPDGNGGFALGGNTMQTTSHASGSSSSRFRSRSDISSQSEIRTAGDAFTWTKGRSRSLGQSTSVSESRGVSQSDSQGVQQGQSVSRSLAITRGKNTTKSVVPFHEYRKSRPVTTRQFLNKDEQMTLALQKIKALPKGHFLLKVPNHKAVFVRAPFVKDPWVSERQLAAALTRIYEQPYYATPEEIAIEETERAARIRALLPNPVPAPKMPSAPLASAKQTNKLTSANQNLTMWDHLADSTEPNTKKSK